MLGSRRYKGSPGVRMVEGIMGIWDKYVLSRSVCGRVVMDLV